MRRLLEWIGCVSALVYVFVGFVMAERIWHVGDFVCGLSLESVGGLYGTRAHGHLERFIVRSVVELVGLLQGRVPSIGRASSGIHEWVGGAGVLVFFVARMAVAGAWEKELGNVSVEWLLLECGQCVCLAVCRFELAQAQAIAVWLYVL